MKSKILNKTSHTVNRALEVLRDAGLRLTSTRKQVLTVLASSAQPLSATEILEQAADKSIDKVTVYRILEALTTHGLVHQLSPDGKYILCEHHSCESPLHALLRCSSCRRIDEVHLPKNLADGIDKFLEKESIQRDCHAVEIQVICRSCAVQG
jgi:Fur family transcriptional regulator, ferric uptake regulator